MAEDSDAYIRTLFKGGSIVFAGLIVELGVSFLAKVISAQLLEQAAFGSVEIGLTVMGVLSTILLFGLNTGLARNLPRLDTPRQKREQFFSALYITVGASLTVGAVMVISAPWIAVNVFEDPSLTRVLQIFSIGIPLAAVTQLLLGGIQGIKDPVAKVTTQNLTLPVTRFIGIAALIAAGYGALGVSAAYVLSFVLTAVAAGYFLFRETGIGIPSLSTASSTGYELLAFSTPLMVTTAMGMVLSDIDVFLLGYFRGTIEVSVYGAVYPLSELLTAVVGAFGYLFMPLLSEIHARGETDEMRRLYRSVTKWISLITLPLFLMIVFFPEWSIARTFGPRYQDGASGLLWLSIGFFSHALAGPNWNLLTSIGDTRIIMYDNIFIALLNVSLNLVLIPNYGFTGAAAATAVSYLVMNGLYSVQLYRRIKIHQFSTGLIYPLVGSTAFFVVMQGAFRAALPESVFLPIVVAGAFAPLYLIIALRLGAVTQDEVMLILSAEERFGVDLGPIKRVAKLFLSE
jgi:O-antigen/teichoic acid export membrane protein